MPNPFSKKQSKFSVISPVYQDAYKTLPKFFFALSEQDYTNFEVIVVFDGPNKAGLMMLGKMCKKYPKLDIKHLVIEHGGAPKARNAGAAIAAGDYLVFLDPDSYLLSETLRLWANAFEEHPEKDVVWGHYAITVGDQAYTTAQNVPVNPTGQPDYWAFRYSNFASGSNPVRKEAFVGWDESVKSLQDWDMWIRMLKLDDFKGEKFHYIARNFFITENVRVGGISHDSHTNWLERVRYIKEKNGIPLSDTVVTSLGAPLHGLHAAKKLGADYLPMPSFKPHNYKKIYLLGFYPGPNVTKQHLAVFAEPGELTYAPEGHVSDIKSYSKATKVIHWIGTDVLKMRTEVPFLTIQYLKDVWKKEKVTHLTEAQHTHDELLEMGIKSEIIPIPPDKLYQPMPLPEQFTVGIYENSTQNMYHETLMTDIVRAMPDIQFKFFGDETKKGIKNRNSEHLGWCNMDKLLPTISCNLRITVHDGLALTPLQFLTAGRNVVANYAMPGAIKAEPDRKSIIEGIRLAQKQSLDLKWSTYWLEKLNFETYKEKIGRI